MDHQKFDPHHATLAARYGFSNSPQTDLILNPTQCTTVRQVIDADRQEEEERHNWR